MTNIQKAVTAHQVEGHTPAAETALSGQRVATAIYVENLRKVYGSKVAVEGLTLQVERGEVFGFLGPNGAGKTTTIKMMNGLARPTSGRMSILGKPLGDTEARKRIGFLPEQFRFHEWLKAEEFLDFHGSLYGLSRAERRQRIPETLKLVGLEHRATSKLKTFSKGMLQRIGIAQAVLADPELVFLDEPTSALDPIGRRDVREIIHTLQNRGMTVFLNSHLLSEVEMVCNRVAIIKEGKVAAIGPLHELLGEANVVEVRVSEMTTELLTSLREKYQFIEGPDSTAIAPAGQNEVLSFAVALSASEVPDLANTLVAGGARLHQLSTRQRSLEDLFVDIVRIGGDR